MNLQHVQNQIFYGKWLGYGQTVTKPLRYEIVTPITVNVTTSGVSDMQQYVVAGSIKTSCYYPFRKGDTITLADGVEVLLSSYEVEHSGSRGYRGKTKRIVDNYILTLG